MIAVRRDGRATLVSTWRFVTPGLNNTKQQGRKPLRMFVVNRHLFKLSDIVYKILFYITIFLI